MAHKPPKRISQTQIAKKLGYSQALVSMVLNGRKQGISEDAYKRIWEYATTHGYSPRGMSIVTSRDTSDQTTIGYILRSPLKLANKSNFFSQVHQGLHDYLDDHNIKMVFVGSEDNIEIRKLPKLGILNKSVKGIAIMGEVQPEFFDGIRKIGLPIVYISSRATGKCHSVLANEEESASQIVNHLFELGHRKFAWVGGDKHLGRHSDRHSGVFKALKRHGLTIDPQFDIRLGAADRMEGSQGAEAIIDAANGDLPTAWICLNGLMARGAISYLFQNGYHVPRDISIAAIDQTRVCVEENPKITGASAIPEDMGSEAARLLLESVNGNMKALTDITLPSQMRVSDSTGPMKETIVRREA